MVLEFIQKYPFILAFIIGIVPAFVWLWFWLDEDIHHEPARMLTLSFIGGMVAVLAVLPIEKITYDYFGSSGIIPFSIWSATEELAKFLFVYFIALRNKKITDEPIDDMIYLIVSALGFVTLENTLFLIDLVRDGNIPSTIIHSNLRFIGASLLHVMSSATIGIFMGLSFYKKEKERIIYTLSGIIIAIVLHTAFNLFILSQSEGNIFFVFGAVWLSIIVLLLLFEKIKSVRNQNYI